MMNSSDTHCMFWRKGDKLRKLISFNEKEINKKAAEIEIIKNLGGEIVDTFPIDENIKKFSQIENISEISI